MNLDESLLDTSVEFEGSGKENIYGLDERLVKTMKNQGFVHPTLVQSKAIPLGLKGKDLLIRAKTGSGKTMAYLFPILQTIIAQEFAAGVFGFILVPSSELAFQTHQVLKTMTMFLDDMVSIENLNAVKKNLSEKKLLKEPHLVVSTPGRLLSCLKNIQAKNESKFIENLTASLKVFAIDEADLMMDFEFKDDLVELTNGFVSKNVQCFIISATLTTLNDEKEEVSKKNLEFLKNLVLHNPVTLTLDTDENVEDNGSITNLNQFFVKVRNAEEKDLLLYALLKLGLIKGKMLFFVNSTDESYRSHLLLQQFCVPRSVVLNNLLPLNNRLGKIDLFNKGLVDIVIASDSGDNEVTDEGENRYNVSRGLDYKEVQFVINYDAPTDVDSYVHRVGRTARAGMFGTALTIIQEDQPEELALLAELQKQLPKKLVNGEQTVQPSPLDLDMQELQSFRYRVTDVRNRISRKVVAKTKLKELKLEMLTSQKVKEHFKANPSDLVFLTAANTLNLSNLQTKKISGSMANVPNYLIPGAAFEADISRTDLSGIKRKLPSKKRKKIKFRNRKKSSPLF